MNIWISLLITCLSGFFGILIGAYLARRLKITELRQSLYFDLLGEITILHANDTCCPMLRNIDPSHTVFYGIKNKLSLFGSSKAIKAFNNSFSAPGVISPSAYMVFLSVIRKELGVGKCNDKELKIS